MEYRVLGRTGVRVSALALGTANFADPTPEDAARQILERAIEAGINLIDSGDSYGKGEAERIIGRALKRSGLRKQVLLTTKVFPPTGPGPNDRGNSRLHVVRACEEWLEQHCCERGALAAAGLEQSSRSRTRLIVRINNRSFIS